MKQIKRLLDDYGDSDRKKKRKEKKLKSKEKTHDSDEMRDDQKMSSEANGDADLTKTEEYKKRRRKLQKLKKGEGDSFPDATENQVDVTMTAEDAVSKQSRKKKHEKKLENTKSAQVKETDHSEPSQPTNESAGHEVSDADAAERQLKEQIREKKREKRRKKKLQKEAEKAARLQGKPVCDLALKYLDTFTNDKDNWKFCKVRQVWLLQHMYTEKIPEKDFSMLLEYLRGLQGKARTQTITTAENILQSYDQDSEDDGTVVPSTDEKSKQISSSANETLIMESKLIRAKQVVQLLS